MQLFSHSVGLTLLIITALYACSGSRQADATNSRMASLIEASSQRTLPGREEDEITTRYELYLIWNGATSPETFFWKDGEAWMPAGVQKVSRVNVPADRNPRFLDIAPEAVQQGDTLRLLPMSGGKFAIPQEAAKASEKAIFFKTGGSGWMHIPVEKMTRKPDIAMP